MSQNGLNDETSIVISKSLLLRVLYQNNKIFRCTNNFSKIDVLLKEVQCDNMPRMWGMLS